MAARRQETRPAARPLSRLPHATRLTISRPAPAAARRPRDTPTRRHAEPYCENHVDARRHPQTLTPTTPRSLPAPVDARQRPRRARGRRPGGARDRARRATRAAAAASSTGTLTGAIINLTPDSRSGPLPGTVELLTEHGRLAARQRVRVGHSFRLVVAAGRYRLTSTIPCSWSTVVVIHAGQIVHDNIMVSDCGP